MTYITVDNRCPECGCVFQTMDDEYGTHSCPRCGFCPHEETVCPGCGEVIEPGEDVYALGDGTITHADLGCLKEAVDPVSMVLEEALQA